MDTGDTEERNEENEEENEKEKDEEKGNEEEVPLEREPTPVSSKKQPCIKTRVSHQDFIGKLAADYAISMKRKSLHSFSSQEIQAEPAP